MASNSALSQLSQRSSILHGRVQLAALNASLSRSFDETDATPSGVVQAVQPSDPVGSEGDDHRPQELPEPPNEAIAPNEVIAPINRQEDLPDVIDRNPGEAVTPNIVSTNL
eukprot:s2350_g2.t1